jgi:hypothetical protein
MRIINKYAVDINSTCFVLSTVSKRFAYIAYIVYLAFTTLEHRCFCYHPLTMRKLKPRIVNLLKITELVRSKVRIQSLPAWLWNLYP